MAKTLRFLCALATAWVAACGGGDDAAPVAIVAVPASAEIGPVGGRLDATLAGGTQVALIVPAGALASPVVLRIDPVDAPAGTLGAFELAPVGIAFAKPATLVLTVGGNTPLSPDLTLEIEQGGATVPYPALVDPAARTVTVRLAALGPAAKTTADAARKVAAGTAAERLRARLAVAAYVDRRIAFEALVGILAGNGSRDNAINAEIALESVLQFAQAARDPALRAPLATLRGVVCGQRDFSVSALDTFNDATDHGGFMRRVGDVIVWGRIAGTLGELVRGFADPVEAGCINLPADPTQPVRQRFPIYLQAVNNGLALLDPIADFDQLLRARFPALLGFMASIEVLTEIEDLEPAVAAIAANQTVRLRAGAYDACRAGRQDLQQRLLIAELGDGSFESSSPYGLTDLHTDILYCGMPLRWSLLDAGGGVLASGDAGGQGVDRVVSVQNIDLAVADRLVLRGPLRALVCPTGSQNNEQLSFSAGDAAGALTGIGVLTPSNANQYLAASSLEIPAATLRALAPASTATAPGRMLVERTGGVCNGEFPLLLHRPLVRFQFSAVLPLRVTTANLPNAQRGVAYTATLAATGGNPPYVWEAIPLPTGVTLDTGTGALAGTPGEDGSFVVSVRVTSADGQTVARPVGLSVDPAEPNPFAGTYAGASSGEAVNPANGDAFPEVGVFTVRIRDDGSLTASGTVTRNIRGLPPAPIGFTANGSVTRTGTATVNATAGSGVAACPFTFTGTFDIDTATGRKTGQGGYTAACVFPSSGAWIATPP